MTNRLTCSQAIARFCAKRARFVFAGSGGGNGVQYSEFVEAMQQVDQAPELIPVDDETTIVAAAIEASLASNSMQVACVTSGEAINLAMGEALTAATEGARVLLLFGCTDPGSWGRWAIQPTEPATIPGEFYSEGRLLKYGALVSHPAQLPRAFSRIAVGMQSPAGFVAALGLTQAVQGSRAPAMNPISIHVALPGPSPEAIEHCVRAVGSKLAVLAGFGARYAAAEVRELVRRTQAWPLTTPRGKGILKARCIGMGGQDEFYEKGFRPERLLILGSRLSEPSCFWDPRLLPVKELIHVDLDASCFGAAYPDFPTYGVVSEVKLFLQALLERLT